MVKKGGKLREFVIDHKENEQFTALIQQMRDKNNDYMMKELIFKKFKQDDVKMKGDPQQ